MSNTTEGDFDLICKSSGNEGCTFECVGLEECLDCNCALVQLDASGPWGDFMDFAFCIFPIVFLIVVTVKPNPMATTRSLPLSALILFLVRVMYLGSDPLLTCGAVILGLHEALTPLSIMAGAITLFEAMEATKCLPYMMREMKALTAGHPVAELMLIYCFAYLIEGASGFGTPVALGAPMLVSTGHNALEAVVTLLIMNTFATVWGAVGTPIWFGFDGLTDEAGFLEISYKSGVALTIGAFILVPLVLTITTPWKTIKENLIFVFLSLTTVMGPTLGLSFFSYEFPSLLGGLVGCVLTAALIRFKVGLKDFQHEGIEGRDPLDVGSVSENSIVKKYHKSLSRGVSSLSYDDGKNRNIAAIPEVDEGEDIFAEMTAESTGGKEDTTLAHSHAENGVGVPENDVAESAVVNGGPSMGRQDTQLTASAKSLRETIEDELGPRKEFGEGYIWELFWRTFPIWAVVLLLILTRVPQIGLKGYLTLREPYFSIHFGTYATFRLSVSIVFQLYDILTFPGLNWKYELLYLPFIMPFITVSCATLMIFRKDLSHGPKEIASTVAGRLVNPALALFGALVLVQLLIRVDTAAPAWILGNILADWFKQGFIVASPLLGMLGSFFSGSTTVSNLTFGPVQEIAAQSIGTSVTTMLALQAVGASAGNGICLNNIIAACTVVGLDIGEGQILKRTAKFVLASGLISMIVMLAFFFRF